ncbi:MAG: hypothetical protein ACLFMN_08425, partial [Desulfobacterales bacterium]
LFTTPSSLAVYQIFNTEYLKIVKNPEWSKKFPARVMMIRLPWDCRGTHNRFLVKIKPMSDWLGAGYLQNAFKLNL